MRSKEHGPVGDQSDEPVAASEGGPIGGEAASDATSVEAMTPAEAMAPSDFMTIEAQSPWAGLVTAAPVFAFVLVNARFFVLPESFGSDRAWFAGAVAVSVTWSLMVGLRRRRQGLPTGKLMPIITGWLVFRGLVGIITANEQIYFGLSIFAKVAIGLGLLVSVARRRDIASTVAPLIFGFSERVQKEESYRAAMRVLTVGAALYEFASAAFDVWLLFIREASANEFVLVRYVVNWGASMFALALAMWFLARRLRTIDGFPGLMAVFEAHVEAQAERLGWDLSPSES